MQQTLTGEEADRGRVVPDTMTFCAYCGEHVLYFEDRREHHEARVRELGLDQPDDADEDDEDDEPERVGSWYTIELSYSADFRFNVPAWSEHEAEDIAKEWVDYPDNCGDFYHVHTRRSEGKEITTEDVPDDFDPYGDTLLWEVFDS